MHTLYEPNKLKNCEYYLKEQGITVEIPIQTNQLKLAEKSISIEYEVKDSQEQYHFYLEMSE